MKAAAHPYSSLSFSHTVCPARVRHNPLSSSSSRTSIGFQHGKTSPHTHTHTQRCVIRGREKGGGSRAARRIAPRREARRRQDRKGAVGYPSSPPPPLPRRQREHQTHSTTRASNPLDCSRRSAEWPRCLPGLGSGGVAPARWPLGRRHLECW